MEGVADKAIMFSELLRVYSLIGKRYNVRQSEKECQEDREGGAHRQDDWQQPGRASGRKDVSPGEKALSRRCPKGVNGGDCISSTVLTQCCRQDLRA